MISGVLLLSVYYHSALYLSIYFFKFFNYFDFLFLFLYIVRSISQNMTYILFTSAIAVMIGDGCCTFISISPGANKQDNARWGIGALLNIILDPVCIYILHWGMAGAAIAAITGQIVSAIMAAVYLFRMKAVKMSKDCFLMFDSLFYFFTQKNTSLRSLYLEL